MCSPSAVKGLACAKCVCAVAWSSQRAQQEGRAEAGGSQDVSPDTVWGGHNSLFIFCSKNLH